MNDLLSKSHLTHTHNYLQLRVFWVQMSVRHQKCHSHVCVCEWMLHTLSVCLCPCDLLVIYFNLISKISKKKSRTWDTLCWLYLWHIWPRTWRQKINVLNKQIFKVYLFSPLFLEIMGLNMHSMAKWVFN